MYASKVHDFFFQPITLQTLKRDAIDFGHGSRVLVALALLGAYWLVIGIVFAGILLHTPAIAFVGIAIWALTNGRIISAALALTCAIAYFNWLWGIGSI